MQIHRRAKIFIALILFATVLGLSAFILYKILTPASVSETGSNASNDITTVTIPDPFTDSSGHVIPYVYAVSNTGAAPALYRIYLQLPGGPAAPSNPVQKIAELPNEFINGGANVLGRYLTAVNGGDGVVDYLIFDDHNEGHGESGVDGTVGILKFHRDDGVLKGDIGTTGAHGQQTTGGDIIIDGGESYLLTTRYNTRILRKIPVNNAGQVGSPITITLTPQGSSAYTLGSDFVYTDAVNRALHGQSGVKAFYTVRNGDIMTFDIHSKTLSVAIKDAFSNPELGGCSGEAIVQGRYYVCGQPNANSPMYLYDLVEKKQTKMFDSIRIGVKDLTFGSETRVSGTGSAELPTGGQRRDGVNLVVNISLRDSGEKILREVKQGEHVAVGIGVANRGNQKATGITLTYEVPEGLRVDGITTDIDGNNPMDTSKCSIPAGSSLMTCHIPDKDPSGSFGVYVQATAVKIGTYDNVAEVLSTQDDVDESDNKSNAELIIKAGGTGGGEGTERPVVYDNPPAPKPNSCTYVYGINSISGIYRLEFNSALTNINPVHLVNLPSEFSDGANVLATLRNGVLYFDDYNQSKGCDCDTDGTYGSYDVNTGKLIVRGEHSPGPDTGADNNTTGGVIVREQGRSYWYMTEFNSKNLKRWELGPDGNIRGGRKVIKLGGDSGLKLGSDLMYTNVIENGDQYHFYTAFGGKLIRFDGTDGADMTVVDPNFLSIDTYEGHPSSCSGLEVVDDNHLLCSIQTGGSTASGKVFLYDIAKKKNTEITIPVSDGLWFNDIARGASKPELSVSLSTDTSSTTVGSQFTVSVSVKSTQSGLSATTVSLKLPEILVYKSADGANCTATTGGVDCDVGSATGKTKAFDIVLTAATSGTGVIEASLRSNGDDCSSVGNRSTLNVAVGGEAGTPAQINVTKTDTVTYESGKAEYADVSYTITISNTGGESVVLDKVADVLDSKVLEDWLQQDTIVPQATYNAGQLIWDSGDLTIESGEVAEFKYTLRIPQANFGTYINAVTAYPQGMDPVNATDTVQLATQSTGGRGGAGAGAGAQQPGTGLLDDLRLAGSIGAVMVVMSLAFVKFAQIDNVLLFTLSGQARAKRRKEEFEKTFE